jgi:hypothetical protein
LLDVSLPLFVFGLGAGKDVDVVVPISIEPGIEVTTAH